MDTEQLRNRLKENKATVCILGLGYVGLPLAIGFAKSGLHVIGYDTNEDKVKRLEHGIDDINETEELKTVSGEISFTSDPGEIKKADFVIICVPTPLTEDKKPDLNCIKKASETIGENMKRGCIVILESTVYPGVTEEFIKPVLEEKSAMKCPEDFKLGYSPERINPGDREHNLENVIKVVSGIDKETTDLIAQLYKKIVSAGVCRTKDIKTAEAAKVIENIQRDLNIALVNELALIFKRMNIDINEVLKAAGTKWNFHPYHPGLVGGHCIPIDPYYLVHRSEELGYKPKIILAGREINDYMPKYVSELAIKELKKRGRELKNSRVLLLGLAFKKNVRDIRNAPSKVLIDELKKEGISMTGYDPLLDKKDIKNSFEIECVNDLKETKNIDCIILVTDHDVFKNISLSQLKEISNSEPIFIDIRAFFSPEQIKKNGFICIRL